MPPAQSPSRAGREPVGPATLSSKVRGNALHATSARCFGARLVGPPASFLVALQGIEWVDSRVQSGQHACGKRIFRALSWSSSWRAEDRGAAEAVGMWAKASISPRFQTVARPKLGTRGKRSRSAKRIVHISTAFFGGPGMKPGLRRSSDIALTTHKLVGQECRHDRSDLREIDPLDSLKTLSCVWCRTFEPEVVRTFEPEVV